MPFFAEKCESVDAQGAIACTTPDLHNGPMQRPSPLDNPETAHFAWARYRRLLWQMAAATVLVVTVVLGWLYAQYGTVSIHLYVAAALGVAVTMMLAGVLMGLAFLSSGTGHDDSVIDPLADRDC